MTILKLTKIPQFNSIVIRQEGGHFFIAAPNSFIIDRDGLLQLIGELCNIGFINEQDVLSHIQEKGTQGDGKD